MKERIEAVQKGFWRLLAVGLVVAAVGVPVRDDGATMDALEALVAFQAGFDRERFEATLLAHANAQGALPLSKIATAVGGRGAPDVRAAQGAAPLQPKAQLSLATLQEIHALSGQSSQIELLTPDLEALARSLGWRLARRAGDTPYTMKSARVVARRASKADLDREGEVVEAREVLAARRVELKAAEAKHEKADALHQARRKWKAPWKSIQRANEARIEAKAEMQEAHDKWEAARDRYQSLADKAAVFKGESGPATEYGVVVVAFDADGEQLELTVPVPMTSRQATVPGLIGADFTALHEHGLWEQYKGLPVADAIARLEDSFSWHYAHVDVAGFSIGAMTLLHLLPLPLLVLLWSLLRRSKGVGHSYNPFVVRAGEDLPRVGFGMVIPNLFVLVLLPLLGSLLCTWSLLQLGQIPALPLFAAAGSIALGVVCQIALKELVELRDAVVRSHSNPPPASSADEPST